MTMVLDGTNGITTNAGTLLSATTIGVGGTTPSTSGAGISFPATQSASSDANTLDDYEEGTWTPVPISSSGSITSYSSSGTYVKVGRSVTIFGQFILSNVGTASGGMSINGLPFTSLTVTTRTALGLVREDDQTGIFYAIAVTSNSTSAVLFTLSTNSNPPWTNTWRYGFTFTYITAS